MNASGSGSGSGGDEKGKGKETENDEFEFEKRKQIWMKIEKQRQFYQRNLPMVIENHNECRKIAAKYDNVQYYGAWLQYLARLEPTPQQRARVQGQQNAPAVPDIAPQQSQDGTRNAEEADEGEGPSNK